MLQLAQIKSKCESVQDSLWGAMSTFSLAQSLNAIREMNDCIDKARLIGALLLSLIDDILDSTRLAQGNFKVIASSVNLGACSASAALDPATSGLLIAASLHVSTGWH